MSTWGGLAESRRPHYKDAGEENSTNNKKNSYCGSPNV